MASNVGQRYARALIDVTEERKETDKASTALHSIAHALKKSPALQQVLLDPRMKTERFSVFEALAQKAGAPTTVISLLRTLDANERLAELEAVAEAFVMLADERLGRVRGHVRSAHELSEAQQKALSAAVGEVLGKKVALDFSVETSLLGGVVVKVSDLVWDGSVKTQLDRMRTALRS